MSYSLAGRLYASINHNGITQSIWVVLYMKSIMGIAEPSYNEDVIKLFDDMAYALMSVSGP